MRKNTIFIPGIGNAQVDLIKHCKDLHFEVHACSYTREGRGIKHSDYFQLINITDAGAIDKYVKENNIQLIYSIGSDLAMFTVCAVSEQLGLSHFVSSQTARICNNKLMLRDYLKHPLTERYSVKHLEISDPHAFFAWETFPAIVKPADSQGQRGIQTIFGKSEIADAVRNAIHYSRTKKAIIEEFVGGFEISVNGYLKDGRLLFSFITERESYDEFPGGIIKSHIFPVTKCYDHGSVLSMVNKVCSVLNIHNGPAYFQVKITQNGQPKLIEVTPRFDGCHIWRLIKSLSGIDLLDITIKHLMREDFTISEENVKVGTKISALNFFTLPPGSVMNRDYFSVSDKAVFKEWFYKNGETIRPMNHYQEKVGYQITIDK